MRQEVINRLVGFMNNNSLDALILCSPENFSYVTGFTVPSQPLLRHRHAVCIVTADANLYLLGVDMEATTIANRAPDLPLKIWKEFSDDPMAHLADLLSEIGLSKAKIGIETGYLPAHDFSRLQKASPETEFIRNDDDVATLRQQKTQEEITLLKRLSLISDQAITEALQNVSAGDTEMDIAAHVTRGVYELGGQDFKLLIVATGERSQLPNVGPSLRVLKPKDVCRVEVFSVIEGYHAAVCRTAVVEHAPPFADEIWQTLVECKYFLLDAIRPGASCQELYSKSISILAKMDLPPISFLGHGIGLFLHEDHYIVQTPVIESRNDATLKPGMVLGVEPLCYETGYGFGMQNKDMVLVTETGCELLSDFAETDKLIVVS